MQRMIYKKTSKSDPEIVWMVNAYEDEGGHLMAIIMRNYDISKNIKENPYSIVKLNRLRPFTTDYNNLFHKMNYDV